MYILVMKHHQGNVPLSGTPYQPVETTTLGRITYAGQHLDVQSSGPMRLRRWETFSLVYVRNGKAVFHSQGTPDRAVGEGSLMLMFPRNAYHYNIDPNMPWSETFVQFDGPVFDLWKKGGLLSTDEPVWNLNQVSVWWARLGGIVAPALATGKDNALHRICLLQAFLADAWTTAHHPEVEPADRAWLAFAENLLTRDLATYPDWDSLSARLDMSYERFRKRFHELARISPAKFRANRRIDWAASLLEQGTTSVDDIARTCGYHDKFHFMKRFKAATGLTPAQYRLRGH